MLWIKAFHLIFMVTWFSGLFYLPRLYVYHAMSTDAISNARFKIMERKLFYGITTPGAIITIILGMLLFHPRRDALIVMPWMQIKLGLVFLLVIYHLYLWKLLQDFKHDRNRHGHVFYRWLNEVPVVFLIGIIVAAIVGPEIFHTN